MANLSRTVAMQIVQKRRNLRTEGNIEPMFLNGTKIGINKLITEIVLLVYGR